MISDDSLYTTTNTLIQPKNGTPTANILTTPPDCGIPNTSASKPAAVYITTPHTTPATAVSLIDDTTVLINATQITPAAVVGDLPGSTILQAGGGCDNCNSRASGSQTAGISGQDDGLDVMYRNIYN